MELKTDWRDSLSAFFLLKVPSRHTDSVCAVPAVRWVLCSSTDELGILLFCPWRDTVWTQAETENHIYPWFHSSTQTLLLECRHTECCKLLWIVLWAVPWLAKEVFQMKNWLHWYLWSDRPGFKYMGCSVSVFSGRRSGPTPLTFFTTLAYVKLPGMLTEICEYDIGKSITSVCCMIPFPCCM